MLTSLTSRSWSSNDNYLISSPVFLVLGNCSYKISCPDIHILYEVNVGYELLGLFSNDEPHLQFQ